MEPIHAKPMNHIPLDLWEEILCRLPVKILMKFRCVCKSWNSLISKDPKFANKNLRMSSIKRNHLVTCTWIGSEKEFSMMSYPLDSLQLHSIFTSKPTLLEYYSPIPIQGCDTLVASCDGLLCFTTRNCLVVLWNPSIRKLKKLPYLVPPHAHKCVTTTYAFGYDPFIDNYKVVSVSRYAFESDGTWVFKIEGNVYTLGTHSWRRINDFPSIVPESGGIIVSGTVNWFANSISSRRRVLASLHLGNECYREISEPNYEMPIHSTLGVIRDCLCIFSFSDYCNYVWLMKEYGNKESWSKLICLPIFGDPNYLDNIPKIVYISEDNNLVLLVHGEHHRNLRWVFYNSNNDIIKSFKIQEGLGQLESKVYVESLISP